MITVSYLRGNINNTLGTNVTYQFKDKIQISGNAQYLHNKNGEISDSYLEQYLQNENLYSESKMENQIKSRSFASTANILWTINTYTQANLSANYVIRKNGGLNNRQTAFYNQKANSELNEYEVNMSDKNKINYNKNNFTNENAMQ